MLFAEGDVMISATTPTHGMHSGADLTPVRVGLGLGIPLLMFIFSGAAVTVIFCLKRSVHFCEEGHKCNTVVLKIFSKALSSGLFVQHNSTSPITTVSENRFARHCDEMFSVITEKERKGTVEETPHLHVQLRRRMMVMGKCAP